MQEVIELGVVLQLAIAPMILIVGVGHMLSPLTNRYGRIIDRSRILSEMIRETQKSQRHEQLCDELQVLLTRARLARWAIGFSVLSLLFTATLVLTLFFVALLDVSLVSLSIGLFTASLGVLIIGIVFFILDINLSLKALELETQTQSK